MDNLLCDIEQFIIEHNMTATAFGLLAVNDGRFIQQLRDGRDLRISTVSKIRLFMDNHKACAA